MPKLFRLRYVLAAHLAAWALRLGRASPTARVIAVERLQVSGIEDPNGAHVSMRLRIEWSWFGRRFHFRQRLHARLGAKPVVEQSEHEAIPVEAFP